MASISLLPQVHSELHHQLHPWLRSDPKKYADRIERSAIVWNIASKIALVAIAAIAAAVLASALFFGTATGALPYILVGLVFATVPLSIVSSNLQSKSKALQSASIVERAAADRFQEIQHWEETEIKQFLENHSVIPLNQTPLKTLLPLIARFNALQSKASIDKLSFEMMIQAADIPQKDREIRIATRSIGWQLLEKSAIPAMLESALVLEILSQPSLQLQMTDIGFFKQKSIEERLADRIYGPDDDYLVFNDSNRKPLTLQEIMEDPTPEALRLKIFPQTLTLV